MKNLSAAITMAGVMIGSGPGIAPTEEWVPPEGILNNIPAFKLKTRPSGGLRLHVERSVKSTAEAAWRATAKLET